MSRSTSNERTFGKIAIITHTLRNLDSNIDKARGMVKMLELVYVRFCKNLGRGDYGRFLRLARDDRQGKTRLKAEFIRTILELRARLRVGNRKIAGLKSHRKIARKAWLKTVGQTQRVVSPSCACGRRIWKRGRVDRGGAEDLGRK